MKELSLDEYRLMMGTQLWLKESFFNFLIALFGGSSPASTQATVSKLDSELSRVTGELSNKNRHTSKPEFKKELNKLNEKLQGLSKSKVSKTDEDMQTGKQKSEATQGDVVDLSNWSVLVHDNSQKRDGKINSLNEKLRSYTKRGYIK